MSLSINDLPSFTPPVKTPQSDVAYASALAGGDILQNYAGAQDELARTCQSTLVEEQKVKWLQEQAYRNKMTVEELVSNPNLPVTTRRKVAEAYAVSAFPVQDLRDKFVIQTAVSDLANDRLDQEMQTEHSTTILEKDQQRKEKEKVTSAASGGGTLAEGLAKHAGSFSLDISRGSTDVALTLGGKAVMSMPAGFFTALSLMYDQDPKNASEIFDKIMSYSYEPRTDIGNRGMQNVEEVFNLASQPFLALGDYAVNNADVIKSALLGAGLAASGSYDISTIPEKEREASVEE